MKTFFMLNSLMNLRLMQQKKKNYSLFFPKCSNYEVG